MTFLETVDKLKTKLRVDASFDLLSREVSVGRRRGAMFFVDGFTKDEVLEKMLQFLSKIPPEDVQGITDAKQFIARFITYVEVDCTGDMDLVTRQVLSGVTALVVEDLDRVILLDTRTYPVRSVQEPESDRVMRGSRDGLVETLVFNTALIRRRLRDPALTFEVIPVGRLSSTDVCICYMADRVDNTYLQKLRKRLQNITIPALAMGQESLAECLLKGQWYNPFPRIRYTERPDGAAASIAEGQIVLLVDNSPAAMILPTSIFDFSQDTNDFYFPPIVGSYLRFVRGLIFVSTLFLTPVWYWLMQNPERIPPALEFIRIEKMGNIPLVVQLLLVEILIDALKLASLNTPTSLSNALSLVGALVFGEFAVQAGLFVAELLAYMAFVAIASFTQPSHELAYAFKLFRVLFIVCVWLLHGWGLLLGMGIMLLTLVTTRTAVEGSYLYPVIPFNGKALMRLMWRQPISRHNAE
ncbi:MAG: spore germination protein [Clostridia bacterium]|nr:spore germination protein [Clostridia bacterium]